MKLETQKFLYIALTAIFTILAVITGFMGNVADKKIKELEKKKTSLEGK